MQAKTVNVGPVTAAVTNQVCASQTPDAGQLVLNGAGGNAADQSIALSQNPTGAGNLTLVASTVYLSAPSYIYVLSSGNDTAFTFTIRGLDANGYPLAETITGANAKASVTTNRFTAVNQVSVSGDAGILSVGSFSRATFTGNTSRQVTIVCAGNESSRTFTVTGTDANGAVISETVTGPNATTATTTAYFRTVTSVSISGNAAGAITIGMTNTASSPWVRFDDFAPSNISIQCDVTGSATYTLQSSLDDPNDPFSPVSPAAMNWVNTSDADLVAATVTRQSNFLFAPKFARVILTTTSTGSVSSVFLQSSNGPK